MAAIALSAIALPASGQQLNEANRNDLQCMAITLYVASSSDENVDAARRQIMTSGMHYFLGRLDGRDPSVEWISYFADHPATFLELLDDPAACERCGQELIALGRGMAAAGRRMMEQAEKALNVSSPPGAPHHRPRCDFDLSL